MKLVVDGSYIARKELRGIGVVSFNFVFQYAQTFPDDKIILVVNAQNEFTQKLQKFENVKLCRIPFHIIIIEQIFIPLIVLIHRADIMLFLGNSCSLFARWLNGTYVVIHDIMFADESFAKKLLRRDFSGAYWNLLFHFLPKNIKIIFPSNFTKKEFEALKGLEFSTKVINWGVDHHNHTQLDSVANVNLAISKIAYTLSSHYIMSFGALAPRKNTLNLITYYLNSDLFKNGYQLAIVGIQDVDAVVSKLNITRRCLLQKGVVLFGFLDNEDVNLILKNASVFAFISECEGFGFPVLEAQREGIPCVVSDNSSLSEISGPHVVFVDPSSEKDVISAINSVLANKTDKDAIRSYAKKFTWFNVVNHSKQFFLLK